MKKITLSFTLFFITFLALFINSNSYANVVRNGGVNSSIWASKSYSPELNLQPYFDFLNIGNSTFYYFDDPSNLIYGEDFEGAHGWVFINDSTNKWVVGSAVSNGTGTKSLYISDDNGVTNKYTYSGTQVSHAYKQIAIPAGTGDIAVSFDWRCYGEGFSGTPYDYFKVWLVAESVTPVAGTQITASATKILLKNSVFNNKTSFITENLIVNAASFSGQNARLVFEWRNDSGGGNQPPAAIDNLNVAVITCSAPSALVLTGATTNTLTVGWTAPATAPAGYELYYSETNTAPTATSTPNITGITGLTREITNLTDNTTYYIWVRSNCGADGTSFWIGPLKANTACLSFTALPFIETFGSTSPTKACWSVIDGNNDGDKWDLNYISNPFVANQVATMYTDNNQGNNDDWLISPTITLTGNQRLKYHYRVQSVNEPNDFRVMLSTTGGQPVNFTHEIVAFASYNNTTYVEKVVNLVDANGVPFTGDVNIAWHVPQGGLDGWRLYIDNVIVEDIPSCPVPTGIGVTNVTNSGATIAWTAGFNETAWEVSVVPSGTGAPTGSGTAVTAATYTPNDLNASTQYEVYVRAMCAVGDNSGWVGPVAFATGQIPQVLPYNEDFEGTVGFAFNNETTNKWVIGTAVSNGTGTKSMYVSKDNGTTYEYNTGVSAVSHAFRDLAIPTGTNEISISFDWKCVGETTSWDRFRVWLVPTSFNPTVGTQITANVAQQRIQIGRENYNGNNVFLRENIVANVAAFAGQNVRLVFEWRNDGSGGSQPPAAIDNLNVAVITCSAPSTLVFTGSTTNTLTVGWTAPAIAPAGYELYYSETNTAPTATTTPSITGITGLTREITNLTDNTTYYIWVRSNCGADGTSFWIGPLKANTACLAFTVLPFIETFGSTSPTKACWTVVDGNNDGDKWDLNYTSNPFVANQVATMYTDNNQGNNDDWLISPTITLTGNQRLKYHYRVQSVSEPNDFRVMVSTTGGQPANFTHEIVAFASYNNTTYIEKIVNLVDANGVPFTGDVNIAWHVPQGGLDGWRLYIDNVVVEDIPSCPDPTDLTVVEATQNTIEVSWTAGFAETAWHVLALPAGAPAPTATTTGFAAATENPFVITNLESSTPYDIYVRANCGVDDLSNWSVPIEVYTECGFFETPFWEGFNSNSTSERCWKVQGINTGARTWNMNYTSNQFEGNEVARIQTSPNSFPANLPKANNEYLISPQLNLTGNQRLKFRYRVRGTSFFKVMASTTGTSAQDFNIELLASQNYTNTNYVESIVDLNLANGTGISGLSYIAFVVDGDGIGNSSELYIDDVYVMDKPFCIPSTVDGITICPTSDSGTSVNWTAAAGETSWEVVVKQGSLPPLAGDLIHIVNEPSFEAQNTIVNQTYVVWIRPICNGGKGDWIRKEFIPRESNITDSNPFCADEEGIVFPNVHGPRNNVYGAVACLGSTPNAVWYFLKVDQPGDLEFDIIQNTEFDNNFNPIGTGLDVDYVAFGPFDDLGQACRESILAPCPPGVNCVNNTSTSSSYPQGNIVDCSFSISEIETLTILDAQPGQIYAILITNFNGSPGFIKLQQTNLGNPGAGSTDCKFLCEVALGDDIVACSGSEVELKAILSTNLPAEEIGAEFTWYKDGVLLDENVYNTQTIIVTEPGVYKVLMDSKFCEEPAEAQIKVSFQDLFEGTVKSKIEVCDLDNDGEGDYDLSTFVLEMLQTSMESENNEVQFYHSSVGAHSSDEADAIALTDSFISEPKIIYLRIDRTDIECYGVYEVNLIIKETIYPIVKFNYDSPICVNNIELLDPNLSEGFTLGGKFSYTGLDGGLFINTDTGVIDVENSKAGVYEIKYSYVIPSDKCGEDAFSTYKIEIFDRFQIGYQGDCVSNKFEMRPIDLLQNIDMEKATFLWTGPGGFESTDREVVVSETGIYKLILTTNDGCYEELSIDLANVNCMIQKGISPNNDGLNDYFDLTQYQVIELSIYNRYGKKVYSKGGYTNEWKGQDSSGNELPDGTYFYEFKTPKEVYTGWIQINK